MNYERIEPIMDWLRETGRPLGMLLLMPVLMFGLFVGLSDRPEAPAVVVDPTEGVEATDYPASEVANPDALSETASITEADTPTELVGKPVEQLRSTVTSVGGDRAFTIGEGADAFYAVLAPGVEVGQAGSPTKLRTGSPFDISGEVRPSGTIEQLRQTYPGIPADIAQRIIERGAYIHVSRVTSAL